nr:MAG TPA: hypothetical protein [Caudoviricetes sp.]
MQYFILVVLLFVTLFLICVAKIKRNFLTNKKIIRKLLILLCFYFLHLTKYLYIRVKLNELCEITEMNY